MGGVLGNQIFQLTVGEMEVIPKRYILAVCKAHGENPQDFSRNRDLEYLAANDADLLFCAILLRLCDLLDFDDTRAPKVLYGYVACNAKSRAEWDKHQTSAGFRYPATPSTDDLPFVKWLLENALLLDQYYQRQFQQIVDCLCNKSGKFKWINDVADSMWSYGWIRLFCDYR